MKALPIGIENFKELIDKNYYYVDKTSFINDIWKEKVALYTRPRRFGKTLSMSMLYYFFSIQEKENAYLFDGLEIKKVPDHSIYQNQYPVIFFSMKDVKGSVIQDQIDTFKGIIREMIGRNLDLEQSSSLDDSDKVLLKRYREGTVNKAELKNALRFISQCLERHYQRKVIILIDEYDVPLQEAYLKGYYDEMTEFLSGIFSAALKTNDALEKGILTGCLRISKESIFTGLNNFNVYSTLDHQSSSCFGFTPNEAVQILKSYDLLQYETTVKEWYDGYLFGTQEIYNPWSVLKYVNKILQTDPDPESFWANTSSNDIVYRYIQQGSTQMKEEFDILSAGGSIQKTIKPELTYRELDDLDNIYSFLLFTGYLKVTEKTDINTYLIKIPNKEIRYIYTSIFNEWFQQQIKRNADEFYKALMMEDVEHAEEVLNTVLFQSMSYFDYNETYYHGFMMGMLQNSICRISSNQESGLGRYDIALLPIYKKNRGLLLELKVAASEEDSENAAKQACEQIKEMKYIEGLYKKGYIDITGYGIAFYKKSCVIHKI